MCRALGVFPTDPNADADDYAADLAAFPNGRRLGDDVTDIEIRAVAQGYGPILNSLFGLPNLAPNNIVGDGLGSNDDMPFVSSFPYIGLPHQGYEHEHHNGFSPIDWLRPDGKTQVSVVYEGDRPVAVDTVVLSTQHSERSGRRVLSQNTIKATMVEEVIRPVLERRFDGRMFLTTSLPYMLELGNPVVTKGSGMEFVAQTLGLDLDSVIAFGDGENDVELLEVAGLGVAVETGHPRLLAVADTTCAGPEDEGVARVIEAVLDSQA